MWRTETFDAHISPGETSELLPRGRFSVRVDSGMGTGLTRRYLTFKQGLKVVIQAALLEGYKGSVWIEGGIFEGQ